MFRFSLQRLFEIFLNLRKTERDTIKKRILVFMLSTRYSCPILMKHQFSQQSCEKSLKIKFHENPSSGSRVVPCGQTDGRTDGESGMTKLIVPKILKGIFEWRINIMPATHIQARGC